MKGYSPFAPTSHLPGASISPPLFRNDGTDRERAVERGDREARERRGLIWPALRYHLARMEIRIALNAILDRRLRLDPDAPPPQILGLAFRAPKRVDVRI